MSNKLGHFNKEAVAANIHNYLSQLPGVSFDDTSNSPVIGYKKEGQRKFATLFAGAYQSLILHVDPGHPNSTIGKQKQKGIQDELCFEIGSIRKHALKQHEAYIPLEKLDSDNPIEGIKDLIDYAYRKQD